MDNIFISFLKSLDVKHTSDYAQKLYEEHPHKYSLYGLSKMLEVYGVVNAGVRVNDRKLDSLETPFIAHIGIDFVLVKKVKDKRVSYLWKDKDIDISEEQFKKLWSGIVLVAETNENSIEPDYQRNRIKKLLKISQSILLYGIPVMTLLGILFQQDFHIVKAILFLLNVVGALTCILLLQKQIYEHGQYADKICSLFKQKDCNDVLESEAAKVFGWISWSEIGLGYFLSNLFLIAIFPELILYLKIINLFALPYTLWSVWYQYRVVKQWCMLCLVVQSILWLSVATACVGGSMQLTHFSFFDVCKVGMIYIFFILFINKVSLWLASKKKLTHVKQELNSLKFTEEIFNVLLEKQPYYQIDTKNSNIIFGNPEASLRISILTNPHCAPCARMHSQVEELLQKVGDKLCIQYVFSAFNEKLLKSNRFLIAAYQNELSSRAEEIYHQWYEKGKYHADTFMQDRGYDINSEMVTSELDKHNEWKEANKLSATPTVLVNGYLLPEYYQIEDIAELVDSIISN